MLDRQEAWSAAHNSPAEITKFKCMRFSHRADTACPDFVCEGTGAVINAQLVPACSELKSTKSYTGTITSSLQSRKAKHCSTLPTDLRGPHSGCRQGMSGRSTQR